jgi:hypothetical protein
MKEFINKTVQIGGLQDQVLGVEFPPQKRVIKLRYYKIENGLKQKKIKSFYLQFPYVRLIYKKIGFREYHYAYAAENTYEKDKSLKVLPLTNVNSTGMVCMGNGNFNAEKFFHQFWQSNFTGSYNTQLRKFCNNNFPNDTPKNPGPFAEEDEVYNHFITLYTLWENAKELKYEKFNYCPIDQVYGFNIVD